MFERIGPTTSQKKHKQERVNEDSIVICKNENINTEKHNKNKKRKRDDKHELDNKNDVSKPTFAELLQTTSSKKRKKRSKRVKKPVMT